MAAVQGIKTKDIATVATADTLGAGDSVVGNIGDQTGKIPLSVIGRQIPAGTLKDFVPEVEAIAIPFITTAERPASPSTVPAGTNIAYVPDTLDVVYPNFSGLTPTKAVSKFVHNGSVWTLVERDINLTGLAKKQVANFAFGVIDDYNWTFSFTCPDGSVYPPPALTRLRSRVVSGAMRIWLDDYEWTTDFTAQDGSRYPPAIPNAPGAVTSQNTLPARLSAKSNVLPNRLIENSFWNQWVEPLMETDNDGNIYISSVGNGRGKKGELWLAKHYKDGRTVRKLAGRVRRTGAGTDDHNAMAILMDLREGAAYPIILFQAEHGTHTAQFCRLTSLDPDAWVFNWTQMGSTIMSYAQAFRYGDEILVYGRTDGPPAGEVQNVTRAIRLAYSSNNGGTWTYKNVFWKSGEYWPYLAFREKADKSGINIAINTHPLGSTEKGMFFLELIWSSGAIINPANRSTPVVGNFRTDIFANGAWVGINPFTDGAAMRVYTPSGTELKRMWDVSRTVSGTYKILYQKVPEVTNAMDNYRLGETRLITFNDAGIIGDVKIGRTGIPNERPVQSNLYFSGCCFVNENLVCLLVHENQSMLDGGINLTPSDGISTAYLIDITNPGTPVTAKIAEANAKLMRPTATKDGAYLAYLEADNYLTFDGGDIVSTAIIEKTSELI